MKKTMKVRKSKKSKKSLDAPSHMVGVLFCLGILTVFICAGLSRPSLQQSDSSVPAVYSVQPVQAPLPSQPFVEVIPSDVRQGDPIMIVVAGASSALMSAVTSISFDKISLDVVTYKSQPTAFAGIDLHEKPGTYEIVAALADGGVLRKNILIHERKEFVVPLGIPTQLGGNTPQAQTNLVNSLDSENKILATMVSTSTPLWRSAFVFPVANPVVTDPYGYLRQTGQYQIAHKGADFKAASGTPVMAINQGVVLFATTLGLYGNTIVIDHGAGITSFYMHLSEIEVNKGQHVQPGQVIGLSGETGYAEGPHLHLTVRINGISIDPVQFFKLFQ